MALLALHAVRKADGALQVADGISLQVAEGETLGVLGPNGAGKTTLFNLITGDVRVDARIQAAGVTIVWIEHVVHALLALAHRLFVLHAGQKLAEGEPRAVLGDPAVQRVYLGVEA